MLQEPITPKKVTTTLFRCPTERSLINLLRALDAIHAQPDVQELTLEVDAFWNGLTSQVQGFYESKQADIKKLRKHATSDDVEDLQYSIAKGLREAVPDVFVTIISREGFYGPKGYRQLDWSFEPAGSEVTKKAVLNVFDDPFSAHVFVKNSPELEHSAEVDYKLRGFQLEQLEEVLGNHLGDSFQAVYLCPAWSPSDLELRKKGSWTYVDKLDLENDGIGIGDFLKTNSNFTFVRHDLTDKMLPPMLPKGSFDLVFYNLDWVGLRSEDDSYKGETHRVAEKLTKPNGLVLTSSRNHEGIQAVTNELTHLARYKFADLDVYLRS